MFYSIDIVLESQSEFAHLMKTLAFGCNSKLFKISSLTQRLKQQN